MFLLFKLIIFINNYYNINLIIISTNYIFVFNLNISLNENDY